MNQNTPQHTATEQEEFRIVLGKLREQFATVYYVDFSKNYAHTYKTNDDYMGDYGNLTTYWEPFSAYVHAAVPKKDQERMLQALQPSTIMERFKTEDAYEIEFEDRSFGDVRYCKFRFIKASEDGSKAVICGIDQTSLVQAEKETQKTLRQNLGIINALGSEYETLFLVDVSTGTFTNIRRDATDMHKPALDAIAPCSDYRDALNTYIDDFVLEGDRERMRNDVSGTNLLDQTPEHGISSITYRRVYKGKTYHYQLNSAKFTDEDGKPYLVVGFRDVTALVEDERRKTSDLATMHAIISAAEMGTWQIELVDNQPGRMHVDDRMAELLGIADAVGNMTPEEIYDTWFSRVKPEAVESVLQSVDSMKDGGRDENTYLWIHPTLGERWVRCGGTAHPIEGGYLLSGYHYDVDDMVREQQKQGELLKDALNAAEHANRAKTTFLNNMSHDIRTPMNAIMGYTALAASHLDNKAQLQDYLSKITTSSSHLLALINDVLDMSRIESGKVTIDEKEAKLPDIMHDVRTIMQSSINAKQLDFFIDTVDIIHEDVVCDKLRLQQVLLNILSNAVKFTEPGGAVSLRIAETPGKGKGRAHYEFRVRDTGIGMSDEFQKHIFEPFTREETSTVSGIQGTGLGMAITKNIVDMMGGTINVVSELSRGTTFTVAIDCKIAGEPIVYERVEELQGIRALVADDDSNTAISVSNMLKDIGMRSDWTLSGREAVLRARVAVKDADEYGVYIIDWMMPDMNGIETVRQIRRHINNDSVPIIILTAYDWADIEEEARAAGVTGFVSKPIFMSELRGILTEPFRANVQHEDETVSEDPVAPANIDVASTKVLLVEDNVMNQEIAEAILGQRGIEVAIADDGDVAVEMLRKANADTYDLVLMDIQMPRMNGYDATRAIRKLPNVAVANMPIVAMTANAFDEDRTLAAEAGMDGYITKPIDIDKTIEVISRFVRRQ